MIRERIRGGARLALCGAAVLACAVREPPRGASVVPIAAVTGDGVAMIAVLVSVPGAPPARRVDLPVRDGVAHGAVSVEPGARVVSARAYDAHGLVTHAGTAVVDVAPGAPPSLVFALAERRGGAPITVVLGDGAEPVVARASPARR